MKKKPKQTTKKLTARENALIVHIRGGMTFSNAALAAGYSKKWPGQASYQALRNIQRKRPRIFHELGLTVEALIERVSKMNAL